MVVSNGLADTTSAEAVLTVQAAPSTELVPNGTFVSGMGGWSVYATPDLGYMQAQLTNGVFEFYRVAPPPGTTNQATIFHQTNVSVASGAPLMSSRLMRPS